MNGFAFEILKQNRDRIDRVALVDRNGARKNTWTSILDKACRVAAYARREACAGTIPVYMDRGMELTATILGLNLAGLGVAPVSITTPMKRCLNIAAQLENVPWTIETFNKACECAPVYEMCCEGPQAEPAYIVFTSGSTGNPKGVELSNEAVFAAMQRAAGPDFFGLDESSRMLQSSSISFVMLIGELLSPLYAGAIVYVLPEESRGDLHLIEDFINIHGITTLFMPPQLYRNFTGGPSLQVVCTGGDRITGIGPKGHRLVGIYGLSETAGPVFHIDIDKPLENAYLGMLCSGLRAYVLGEDGKEAEEGELCISGPIADGYLGLHEMSMEAFASNPFSDEPDFARLLHTGDIVRRSPDGSFIYINRKDNMIKVNGQRVEPGEIEIVLMKFPGIDNAAVKGFTDEKQHSIVCAYYTCSRDIDEDAAKAYLESELSHYMVPSVMVRMEKMPLNANGKLDRKALKMPDLSQYRGRYEKPQGESEQIICKAFEKVLGIAGVGRNDDFFRIGGDSIAAISVVRECESLGISTGDIFAGKTPRSIAGILQGNRQNAYVSLPSGVNKTKLTDSQLGVLLECGLEEESAKYDIPVRMSFERTEKMTAAFVKAAVDKVIKNHPALYARIISENGEFFIIREEFPEKGICEVTEFTDEKEDSPVSETAPPIAIGRDPLCSAKAYIGHDSVKVLMNMHHIISDGTSVEIIAGELGAALKGNEPEPEIIDSFSLYEAQERIRKSEAYGNSRIYFEHLLAGMENDSNLIYDHKPAENARPVGARLCVSIPLDEIKSFTQENGITESTFFMGVYGYALAKMTGQNESIFCAAENGRESALLKNTVSMLVRTLPVVFKADEEKTGMELLKGLQGQFFATMRNGSVGFRELADEYGIRSDVMFVYQADMFDGMDILETGESLSNLSLSVLRCSDEYKLSAEYRSDMYDEHTIERFLGFYIKAAASFIRGIALKDMVLIPDSDRAFLDAENESNCHPIGDETIIDIFKNTAARHPQKPAIISAGNAYTYEQVADISDRVAAYLLKQGIGKGSVVSVLIPRNEYMLIASLGIMKTGAAYQPLDPSYPEERLSFMVSDANASFIIIDRKYKNLVKGFEGKSLFTDEIPELPTEKINPVHPSLEDRYILLYTSGTTGTPKGVMLSHGNLRALVHALAAARGLEETSVVTQYASYGFDAHMHELYPAVLKGCTIVVVPDEVRLDLAGIKEFCESFKVTHLFMTTQVARQFATTYSEVKGLKVLETAGEKLVSFEPRCTYKILNLYGPTEGTVCTTKFVVDKYYDNIPIGKAIRNYRLYVADNYGRRVPIGVPGELIQCGPQVGIGYLGRPELTEKAFVANAFEDAGAGYETCYKTGDIVRFLEDGNIEYIGRRDHQVKIRGFRIELGEVEKAIRDFPGIKDATVAVTERESGKSLCAYVVSDEKVDIAGLRSFIGQEHPSYMIPAVIMQIDSIPLNVNGKVDKRKLPKPKMQLGDIKKPENELQQRIFDCAKEAIGAEDFGTDTDIFMAGLSSIGSIKLCALLAESFEVAVKMRDLKKCPTVIQLEEFIRAAGGTGKETETNSESQLKVSTAGRSEKPEYGPAHPITKNMEGIFSECLKRPDSTVYNIPYMLRLGDGIDEDRLRNAIAAAVEAHPCMKAELFTDENGNICQHRRVNDTFTAGEVRTLSLPEGETVSSSLVTPFKLTDSRLFDISLIHADGTYLFINIHHIIADGVSMAIFVNDIQRSYEGNELKTEDFSSFDVADEEARERSGDELKACRNYYASLLEGLDKDFLIAADKQKDMSETRGVMRVSQAAADAAKIRSFCEEHRISMNAFFISAFGTVLARYAGTDYSVFNTVYNGRNDSRTGSTVAMLVKTLPVVCNTDKENVSELMEEMSSQLLGSMTNDLYSFSEISREFGVKNDVMFIFQGEGFTRESFCSQKAGEIPLQLSENKAPIVLQVMIKDGQLVYELEYDSSRYTEELARAFVLAVDKAAGSFAEEEKLRDISILSENEEAEMEKYNATEADYDKSETIADLFVKRARLKPDSLCVAYKGKKLTYAGTCDLTARLAYFLANAGIGRGDVVAILINRDENMVIGALGAIRAGAAYVGLDPTYPKERLEFMLKDSEARYLIADRSLMHLLGNYTGNLIYTDEIAGLRKPSDEEIDAVLGGAEHKPAPDDNALIIFSSGTTGLPKGSVLRHRNIVCFYHNYTRDMGIEAGSHVATYASFGFDGGAQDVLGAPMAGAALYIIPDDIRLDLGKLEQFFVKNEITSCFMTTQVGCMFIANTKCRSLKAFQVGGEKLIPVKGPDWVTFANAYGPSETMCYVNRYIVSSVGSLQPIGKVSRNTKEYVIDKYGNRLPYGACGELCIAGGQVGAGYMNRPEKTSEVFISNPFSTEPGYSVLYRTGDIVRMLPDGNYDYVGRRDGQIKIRGFRVELEEIELQIRKYPGVTNAVVRSYDNPSGGKYLAAYVACGKDLDTDELKNFIGLEKPDYMVPSAIMRVDSIPLTSNGKVDAARLPKPELGSQKKGAEPENATEEKLCSIFEEVIGIPKVYADDDFFKVGGSSISAISAVVKCEQAGYPIVYKNIFANPTPRKLAAFIAGERAEDINAGNLNSGEQYDYSALSYNVISNLPGIKNEGVGDVLLTGVTGFLGSHIFRELIESAPGRIICLVRGHGSLSAEDRFKSMMVYYFEDDYEDEIKQRTMVVDGDIEDEEILEKIGSIHIDTIINSAANVKHFAVEDELMSANYSGVENLIKVAEKTGARLIQISSLSICGESVNGSVPKDYIFKETDLNVGQSLENKYVYTKYLAEQAVIDAISRKRIRGKVIRLGNLMARIDDGQFQVNAETNGMLRLYLGFVKLGCFPVDMLDSAVEFSPVDRAAKAIVMLSGTRDEFTVFHAENCNYIHYSYLLQAIVSAGYPVEIVENDVFEKRLARALESSDNVNVYGGLLAYKNSVNASVDEVTHHTGDENADSCGETRIRVSTSSAFTTKALYRLGFSWPLVSMEYMKQMIEMLRDFNFFED